MSKEEYELKKQERLQEKESQKKDHKRGNLGKKIFKWIIFLAVIGLIVWGLIVIVDKNTPKGDDFSVVFPSSGRDHINIGTGSDLPEGTYSSNPPSSGPHYPNTARTGFYDEPLEDQFMIHNLEHGDIWIAYSPKISNELKERLRGYEDKYVIITPREKNEFDISLVAWGRVDSFNFDESINLDQRVRDFILRYDDKGPERVRGGAGHQTTSFN